MNAKSLLAVAVLAAISVPVPAGVAGRPPGMRGTPYVVHVRVDVRQPGGEIPVLGAAVVRLTFDRTQLHVEEVAADASFGEAFHFTTREIADTQGELRIVTARTTVQPAEQNVQIGMVTFRRLPAVLVKEPPVRIEVESAAALTIDTSGARTIRAISAQAAR